MNRMRSTVTKGERFGHYFFEVIPGDPGSSVVLHVPHASIQIPDDVRSGIALDDDELHAELTAMTDASTDSIAERAVEFCGIRPWIFVNRTSRLVVDPERFPDEREEMNAIGMGVVYERTSDLRVLRNPGVNERAELIDRFFMPYSTALAQLVRDRLTAAGRVTIIDLHSYPVMALPYELHADGHRPEICVGTDSFHTPPELVHTTTSLMQPVAPTGDVALDSPFAGCYVPLDQYGVNQAVRGLMLEIRRDVVTTHLDELAKGVAALVGAIDGLGIEGVR